jgi:hypothetical protein
MYLGNSSDNELYKQPITIKRSKGAQQELSIHE